MAGLYIHVPFCAKRCLYCDFYSNTNMSYKRRYVSSVIKEMQLRADYLKGEEIETIYFGGGTPSQLDASDFSEIFDSIYYIYNVSDNPEITLEANPDDVTDNYMSELRTLPFNRISMGVQSFDSEDLVFLNRRHTSEQAIRAVEICKNHDIYNISIDLIYGLPGQTPEKWEKNLQKAISLDIPHISAYHLIYEEGTALYKLWEAGKVSSVDEETSVELFSQLISRLKEAGYLHYEISNFAREGFFSRHNSSYWKGISYLGLGPSAHSFNGEGREWNVSSLPKWIEALAAGKPAVEKEVEDADTSYNDYIITGLRTMWGINLDEIEKRYGDKRRKYCEAQAKKYIEQDLISRKDGNLTLTEKGVFISDGIMSDLLWV